MQRRVTGESWPEVPPAHGRCHGEVLALIRQICPWAPRRFSVVRARIIGAWRRSGPLQRTYVPSDRGPLLRPQRRRRRLPVRECQRIGSYIETSGLVRPAHKFGEVLISRAFSGAMTVLDQDRMISEGAVSTCPRRLHLMFHRWICGHFPSASLHWRSGSLPDSR